MFWPALVVVVLDQASKWAVLQYLRIHETVPLLSGFFNLVHVRNRGMAFGFLNRSDINFAYYLLVGASLVAIGLLLIWFFTLKDTDTLTLLALSLILGGAVGNLIDRLRFREVIDFLDIYVGPYHWPAFNLADASITVGTILMAATLFFGHRRLNVS